MRVSLFAPCLVDRFLPRIGEGTVALLEQAGFEVEFDARQTCCGQPAFNAGYPEEALSLARRFIELFHEKDVVVSPSGSCVAMVREHYGLLPLPDDVLMKWQSLRTRVFELSEFLDGRGVLPRISASFPMRAAVHLSCHHLRFIKAQSSLERLLARVQGLDAVVTPHSSQCCGFGGVFSAKLPELSVAMGKDRVASYLAQSIDAIVMADAGCVLQLQGILRSPSSPAFVPVLHYAELFLGSDVLGAVR